MLLLVLAGCPDPKSPSTSDTGRVGGDDSAPCVTITWYADDDGDSYGGAALDACEQPDGYVSAGGDCDDAAATTHPTAAEFCDGLDQDCDGLADEDLALFPAAPDADADGYGDAAAVADVCAVPDGWTTDATDCDDADAAVNPAADEWCNGYDDDCDGLVDDADSPVLGVSSHYADDDGDGYGDDDEIEIGCGSSGVDIGGDCDDDDATINPDAEEICLDLIDQDCDGLSDDYTCDLPAGGDVDLCDATIAPVDASLCTAGVAAVLASGATHATVQDALDAAVAGDVVTVCPGTWTEDLVVTTSPLSIVGYGIGTSVLHGARSTTLNLGAGQTLTLVDLSVEGGAASDGAGLAARDVDLCIANVAFANNHATYAGGGIYLSGTGVFSADNSLFYGNRSDYEGGGADLYTYTVTIEDTSFYANWSGYEAGGLELDSTGGGTITNTEFVSNFADYEGGGIEYGGRGPALSLDLTDVTFTDNTAGYSGGAMELGSRDDFTVNCVSCVFDGNSATYEGGAVNLGSWDAGTFNAAQSTFTGNSSQSGGAINLGGWGSPTVNLEDCTLDGNTATSSGGALLLYVAGSSGWATVTVTDSYFTSNTAGNGGGASVDSNYATLTSVNTDWGTGATDNAPDDVGGYGGYGTASSFTCTLGACL